MESLGLLSTLLIVLLAVLAGAGIGAALLWSRLQGAIQAATENGRAEAQLKSSAALAKKRRKPR